LKHDGDDTVRIINAGAAAVAFKDSLFKVSPLLLTSENRSWLKAGDLVIDSAAPVFSPEQGDVSGSFATGIQLTRKINHKEQRILVFGDVDFLSNLRVGGNLFFVIPSYSWLNDNQFPIYTPHPPARDNFLKIGPQGTNIEKTMYIWIVPALILLAGIVILIRRKRK